MVASPSDIEILVDAEIAGGSFPGIVLLVSKDGKIVYSLVRGNRQVKPEQEEMTEDTIFDLASVTKPLATALLALLVCGQERISLDEKIGTFVPEIAAESRTITLGQLLVHTGGLPPVPLSDPRTVPSAGNGCASPGAVCSADCRSLPAFGYHVQSARRFVGACSDDRALLLAEALDPGASTR